MNHYLDYISENAFLLFSAQNGHREHVIYCSVPAFQTYFFFDAGDHVINMEKDPLFIYSCDEEGAIKILLGLESITDTKNFVFNMKEGGFRIHPTGLLKFLKSTNFSIFNLSNH